MSPTDLELCCKSIATDKISFPRNSTFCSMLSSPQIPILKKRRNKAQPIFYPQIDSLFEMSKTKMDVMDFLLTPFSSFSCGIMNSAVKNKTTPSAEMAPSERNNSSFWFTICWVISTSRHTPINDVKHKNRALTISSYFGTSRVDLKKEKKGGKT